MMIAAGGNERGLRAEALRKLETEHAAAEAKSAVEIGDLEVNVANAGLGMDGRHGHRMSPKASIAKLGSVDWLRDFRDFGRVVALGGDAPENFRIYAVGQGAVARENPEIIS